MAEVTIADNHLQVRFTGMRALACLQRSLTFPLSAIRGATHDPDVPTSWPGVTRASQWPGRKVLGTDVYGHYLGGTFRQDGRTVFWDVADPAQAVVITLRKERFAQLILEVNQPHKVVSMIEQAIHHDRGRNGA